MLQAHARCLYTKITEDTQLHEQIFDFFFIRINANFIK
jgi:hypothetical protein